MQQPQRIDLLLKAYGAGTASADEIRELFRLLEAPGSDESLKTAVFESLAGYAVGKPGLPAGERQLSAGEDPVWQRISGTIRAVRRRSLRRRSWFAAAALLVSAGLVTWFGSGHRVAQGRLKADVAMRRAEQKPDVSPGTDKATLTLSDGRQIWLDSARSGALAEQGNVRIVKPAQGQLAYTAAGAQAAGTLYYNTLATPRGGQYQLKLPDGTKVWLNASSTLRFPTAFESRDRRVQLTGEAYFEVAKDASRPFHVAIGATDIRVLGTHFNVMGYANEKELRTTLLEGKINVTSSGRTKKLVPGNEAVIGNGTHAIAVARGNTDQAVAWKNGLFRFHETGIRSIMRQLERWYDVDVDFQTEAKDQDFTGVISRRENLSAVLQTLELTGTVHFRIEGKRVVVLQ